MRRDVHLSIGTKVINAKTGRLGEVTEPHYMARPDPHEVCIAYDGSTGSFCEDRADVEYQGNGAYEDALVKWGHVTQADFKVGDRVFDKIGGMRGTVESRDCREDYVIVKRDDGKGTDLLLWTSLRKVS